MNKNVKERDDMSYLSNKFGTGHYCISSNFPECQNCGNNYEDHIGKESRCPDMMPEKDKSDE